MPKVPGRLIGKTVAPPTLPWIFQCSQTVLMYTRRPPKQPSSRVTSLNMLFLGSVQSTGSLTHQQWTGSVASEWFGHGASNGVDMLWHVSLAKPCLDVIPWEIRTLHSTWTCSKGRHPGKPISLRSKCRTARSPESVYLLDKRKGKNVKNLMKPWVWEKEKTRKNLTWHENEWTWLFSKQWSFWSKAFFTVATPKCRGVSPRPITTARMFPPLLAPAHFVAVQMAQVS